MKSQKGFVPIVIILMVLLGIGSAYYIGTIKPKSVTVDPTPIVSLLPSPSVISKSATPDPTAKWETYANEKMKVLLKYPPEKNLKIITSQYNNLNFALNTEQYAPLFLEVTVLPNTTMEKWYQFAYSSAQQESETAPTLKQYLQIGNYASFYSDFVQQGNGMVRYVFIQVGDNLYQIVIPVTNNELQEQILSTFKFIQ